MQADENVVGGFANSGSSSNVVANAMKVFGSSSIPVSFGKYDSFYSSLRDSEMEQRQKHSDSMERMRQYRGDGIVIGGRRRRNKRADIHPMNNEMHNNEAEYDDADSISSSIEEEEEEESSRAAGFGIFMSKTVCPSISHTPLPASPYQRPHGSSVDIPEEESGAPTSSEQNEPAAHQITPIKKLESDFTQFSLDESEDPNTETRFMQKEDQRRIPVATPSPPPTHPKELPPFAEHSEGVTEPNDVKKEEATAPDEAVQHFLFNQFCNVDGPDMARESSAQESAQERQQQVAESTTDAEKREETMPEQLGTEEEDAMGALNDVFDEDAGVFVEQLSSPGEYSKIDDGEYVESVQDEKPSMDAIVDKDVSIEDELKVGQMPPPDESSEIGNCEDLESAQYETLPSPDESSKINDVEDVESVQDENPSMDAIVDNLKEDDLPADEIPTEDAPCLLPQSPIRNLVSDTDLLISESLIRNHVSDTDLEAMDDDMLFGVEHFECRGTNNDDGCSSLAAKEVEAESVDTPQKSMPSTTHNNSMDLDITEVEVEQEVSACPSDGHASAINPATPSKTNPATPKIELENDAMPYGKESISQEDNHSLPVHTRSMPASHDKKTMSEKPSTPLENKASSKASNIGTSSSSKRKPKKGIWTPLKRVKLEYLLAKEKKPWGSGVKLYNGRSVDRIYNVKRCTHKFCQWEPDLHSLRAACERCWTLASSEEREDFIANGRHLRIAMVKGGCPKSCTLFSRVRDSTEGDNNLSYLSSDEPLRLCRRCFGDMHHAGIREGN
eukprot:CAMPEP_0183712922 /NCGR_PEP_ID=MMETSP0737-20130205/7960_1 /TAXON_ID=385413 /ORGANISM="Thalassiosira miniscula, Strain CCMP1093" /LENGTH=785 /DNA_ID=CAMNT_0025941659 /DNA_START=140 /DNA_END=2497 /DNA_ORIENTATION=-